MSLVAISGNASGTGTLTIAAPNTNSNRTLTLPDGTGTFNISGVVNEVPAGTASAPSIYSTGDTNTGIFFPAADTIAFSEGGTEAMRIDSSGNLLVGGASFPAFSGKFLVQQGAADASVVYLNGNFTGTHYVNATNGSWSPLKFWVNGAGSNVGSINCTTSATSYATSSDYRLKEDIEPMVGALAKVTALKPCTYKWKVDGSSSQGFIAHELQEFVPECVVGEKDAIDADGNPVYQGIDTSFLVATLTAAIQEQQAIITQLQTDVAALKGTTP